MVYLTSWGIRLCLNGLYYILLGTAHLLNDKYETRICKKMTWKIGCLTHMKNAFPFIIKINYGQLIWNFNIICNITHDTVIFLYSYILMNGCLDQFNQ